MFPKKANPKIERVEFALRTTGVDPSEANPLRGGTHTRGYLPHVKREGASYFVTFRLADSLPREVLLKFQQERADRLQRLPAKEYGSATKPPAADSSDSEDEINRDYYRKVERFLDQSSGACHLRHPEIAALVANAIRHFKDRRYVLGNWVVMPNHVHAVIWPMPNDHLSAIVKSWKGFAARQANKILNRTGEEFWQRESFDHWIRNDEEKARISRYVVNNPVKAGLCKSPEDWRWSSAWPGWKDTGP